jgi:hypothetical protein
MSVYAIIDGIIILSGDEPVNGLMTGFGAAELTSYYIGNGVLQETFNVSVFLLGCFLE